MPTAKKPSATSKPSRADGTSSAKAGTTKVAAPAEIDWCRGTVTHGGGVAATIALLRGPADSAGPSQADQIALAKASARLKAVMPLDKSEGDALVKDFEAARKVTLAQRKRR